MKCTAIVICSIVAIFCFQYSGQSAHGVTTEKDWKFVVLCDTRSNPCDADGGVNGVNTDVLGKIAAAVATDKPDLVLVPGDMILGNGYQCKTIQTLPNPPEEQFRLWRHAMKPVYESGIKVLPLRGNHEMDKDANLADYSSCRQRVPVDNTILAAFKSVFNDPYIPANGPLQQEGLTYAFSHKNARFIGLDEIVDQFQVDLNWFEKVLAKDKREHLFVFGHYPAFTVKHKDCLACYGKSRDRFWDAIGNAGGRLYFCGHDHFYDRAVIPDRKGRLLQQVLVGNGGAPYSSTGTSSYPDPRVKRAEHIENSSGYLLVTVKGAAVEATLKVLDQSGSWIDADSFRYTKKHSRK